MKRKFLFYICSFLLLASCLPGINVFEKNVSIPHHEWQSSFIPDISFAIEDTAASYNIYFVVRHTDAYRYNNLWIKASVLQPGESTWHSAQYDLTLADKNKWLGSAMDDIYEHRVLLQKQTRFSRKGSYHFSISQVMREDPLPDILDVGLRIEKSK